ncbi:hypothetical protein [Flavobacterium sp.]|uniref:hypothetical protein n=1 Tax=Flavobacterium sp. TaxID=239 RepID=UPI004047F9C2
MEYEILKKVVVAVQDYRIHGYSNTAFTDKGYIIIAEDYDGGSKNINNITNYRRITFEKALGNKFGKEDIILEPRSLLFQELLKVMELKIKDLVKDNPKEFLDHELDRYDEKVTFFGEEIVVNARNQNDRELVEFYEFYEKIKRFYDYNYPLYLLPANQEDREKYYGDHERGNYYEPISPQK